MNILCIQFVNVFDSTLALPRHPIQLAYTWATYCAMCGPSRRTSYSSRSFDTNNSTRIIIWQFWFDYFETLYSVSTFWNWIESLGNGFECDSIQFNSVDYLLELCPISKHECQHQHPPTHAIIKIIHLANTSGKFPFIRMSLVCMWNCIAVDYSVGRPDVTLKCTICLIESLELLRKHSTSKDWCWQLFPWCAHRLFGICRYVHRTVWDAVVERGREGRRQRNWSNSVYA